MAAAVPVFRVFVSSTFEDMRAERQALHERVFPVLVRFCREQGARFQPIDLRWGVSEEAGRDHRTMQICLDEIARCQRLTARPNFLALVGDRYGWRPAPAVIPASEFEAILDALADRPAQRQILGGWYSRDANAVPATYVLRAPSALDAGHWAQTERELTAALRAGVAGLPIDPARRLPYEASATHLEIERGVLSVADPGPQVVCVLRSIDGLPAGASAAPFVDLASDGSRDGDAGRRIAGLRDALRRALSGSILDYRPRWPGHGSPLEHLDEMCAAVQSRLRSLIERELDAAAGGDEEHQEQAAQWSFARARIADAAGTRPSEAEARVLSYFTGDSGAPLILTGPGGVGKTTVAARVAAGLRERADVEVFLRFVGVSAGSASAPALLAELAREAGHRYGLGQDIPASYDALVSDLWARLGSASDGRRTAVIIDGADLLASGRSSVELDWLPARLPPQVRVLVSAAPGAALDYLLGLPEREIVELAPLSKDEGGVVLDRWLAERGRTLQPAQRHHVLDRFAANGLPLYLRLATEEAVRWRSDDPESQAHLEQDVAGIVRGLFRRLSGDAEHGPVLVASVLGYLACGRRGGLAEDELLAVLAADAAVIADVRRLSPRSPVIGELPVAVWSRLLADLAPYLAERRADGVELMVFFHRLFSEVVDDVLAGGERRRLHDHLAGFFAAQPIGPGAPDLRVLAELPYQLAGADRGRDLATILTDYTFLYAKLRAAGSQVLLEDFTLPRGGTDETGTRRVTGDAVDAVAGVLERAAALLSERPSELASQLHARLLDIDDADVQAMLARTRDQASHAWMRPLRRSLSRPGGPLIRTIETRGGSTEAIALTPDGRRVLATCQDGTIEVWDVDRGQLARTLYGHGVFARCVAVTPDGHRAVSGGRTRAGQDGQELRVWDLDQGRPVGVFEGHDHDFGEIAVLPDGNRAVSSSYDATVRVWDLSTGQALRILRGHAWYAQRISVSADGRIAASGADDGTIRIWDLERGAALRVLETDHPVRASSPDELQPGALIGVTQVTGVALTPDARLLVSTSPQEGMYLWDVEAGARLARFGVSARAPRITKDGRLLVFINDERRAVEVWDLQTGTEIGRTDAITSVPSELALSDDGHTVVVAGGSTLTVWQLDRIIGQGAEPARAVSAVAIVAGEPRVTVVSAEATLEGWSLATGQRLWQNTAGGAQDLVPIPGRPAVLAGGFDGGVAIVDAQSGTLAMLTEGPYEKRSPASRPERPLGTVVDIDGMIIEHYVGAAAPRDRPMRNLQTVGNLVFFDDEPPAPGQPEGPENSEELPVRAVAVAPDGRFAVTASGGVLSIWDLAARRLMRQVQKPHHDVKALAVTPDSSVLVSLADRAGSADENNLTRWELPSGREIADRPPRRNWLHRTRSQADQRSSSSSSYQTRPLAITGNGEFAVSALFGDGLRAWQVRGPLRPRTLHGGSQEEAVAALPGRHALAPDGYGGARLLLWDLQSGRPVGALVGHKRSASAVVVAADGNRALSIGSDLIVHLWDLRSLESLATFTVEDFPIVCALTADGDTAVVGDGRSLHLLRFRPAREDH